MLLGAALGLGMGVTLGCMQDEDFVPEFAAEVCRMVRDCGRELRLPNETDPLPATAECEALVEAHYSACGDSCFFRRNKARRCLRRLRNNECSVDDPATPQEEVGDESIPWVCDDVFSECEGGEDQAQQCAAPHGCAVSGRSGAGALPLIGLLLLGTWRRRR
jgi:MYXO-CTERM domain-containing protein